MHKRKKKAPNHAPKRKPKREAYSWDLYRDGITQSGLRLFLTCRHQFYLAYVKGWTPRRFSTPMFFGSAVHDILASVHGGLSLDKAVATFESKIDEEMRARTDVETIDHYLMLAQEICTAYNVFWERDAEKTWVVREATFHVPYRVMGVALPIPLCGRWDGGYTNQDGLGILLETKTKGQIDETTLRLGLPLDLQTLFYAVAADEGELFSTGSPDGVLYDVVRRPGQRRKKNEPLPEFLERVREDIAARPAHYFMRWLHLFEPNTLKHWKIYNLNRILFELVMWYDDITEKGTDGSQFHYMNPAALVSGWGPSAFFNMITQNTTFGYYKRSVPFPELED